MRCTSTGKRVAPRTARTASGPMVMSGVKRPSMTSTWIQSAPACSTARTSSPSRLKSAARIDVASLTVMRGPTRGGSRTDFLNQPALDVDLDDRVPDAGHLLVEVLAGREVPLERDVDALLVDDHDAHGLPGGPFRHHEADAGHAAVRRRGGTGRRGRRGRRAGHDRLRGRLLAAGGAGPRRNRHRHRVAVPDLRAGGRE